MTSTALSDLSEAVGSRANEFAKLQHDFKTEQQVCFFAAAARLKKLSASAEAAAAAYSSSTAARLRAKCAFANDEDGYYYIGGYWLGTRPPLFRSYHG